LNKQPPFNTERAEAEQRVMADRVSLVDDHSPIANVCGVDLAYATDTDQLVAAAVVLDYLTLEPIDQAVIEGFATVPYIPGLLSFREAPWALAAIESLSIRPHLVVCDGQGIAHPARFGLACHIGVELDLPSIGCAKTHFVGDYDQPAPSRGSRSDLLVAATRVGVVLRTQDNVKPLFVSPGHRMSIDRAADLVLALTTRYRQPETTRAADHLARRHLADLGRG
jgi:deoxyribonuclease V